MKRTRENTFGLMVREVREHQGLSRLVLAEKLGISFKTLLHIEQDLLVPEDPFVLEAIKRVLHIPSNCFLLIAKRSLKNLKSKEGGESN